MYDRPRNDGCIFSHVWQGKRTKKFFVEKHEKSLFEGWKKKDFSSLWFNTFAVQSNIIRKKRCDAMKKKENFSLVVKKNLRFAWEKLLSEMNFFFFLIWFIVKYFFQFKKCSFTTLRDHKIYLFMHFNHSNKSI